MSNGAIQSLQVTARYRPDLPPALSDVTFTVKPGQKVGICGRTGSGKSTLLGVLWRLIEQDGGRGTISVDGVNIRDVTLQDYIGVLIPQEDRSRIHFKRTILPSKNLLGIVNLDHPAASPDLNPIEHMWNIMKASLRKRKTKFTSVGELWKWIQEEWDAIPITTVNKLIDSMEERRLAVIRVKGMSTGY